MLESMEKEMKDICDKIEKKELSPEDIKHGERVVH